MDSGIDLSVEVCGVRFKNPVIAASGTFGFGREYSRYFDPGCLGGIAVKGLTLKPKKGNPPPRIAETPCGILNSVGLQNPGVDRFIEYELPQLLEYDTRIIVNINGSTVEEYCKMAEKFRGVPVDMIEVNVSCPNVNQGGMAFGTDPDMIYRITREVKRCAKQPVVVKLTPATADIAATARAVQEAGGDGVSLINTIPAMAIDAKTRRPVLAVITGGLSGPAIKPVALRMVWEVSRSVNIPIIGMGGIMTGEDAVEFLLAGATAVGVGTANLVNPLACVDIIDGLVNYMRQHGITDVKQLIGGLRV